ncbi:MAG TPA: DUF5335 domain-containing protein [Xanthobacteraceae bacterium]|nr:DUF5335 domain-containing protein [Xanthobacteraceae bacterium]
MTVRSLAKEKWQSYCDQISKGLVGKHAYIEVGELTFGDQVVAKWLPLLGITYESKDDLLEIALEGVDHLIRRPASISVDDGPDGLKSMEIVDSDRRRQIVRLAEPLLLPPSGFHTAQDERR